jgi:hypothetical protein
LPKAGHRSKKEDIYKGGEIGYDEAEQQAQVEPMILKNGEESLEVRVWGVPT